MNLQWPIVFVGVVALFGFVFMGQDQVAFLDVGQGDATLLQRGSVQVLVDGGQGSVVLDRLAKEMPWFDRNLEIVVLTHPDKDHLEGLIDVVDRYEVGLVLMPLLQSESDLYAAWLNKLDEKNITYRFAWSGQRIVFGDVELEVVAPIRGEQAERLARTNPNDASVGTRVVWGDMSFLLTGDSERVVEHLIVQEHGDLLDVDVLKVGHHGSKTSTTQSLLDASSPSAAVISAGADNRYEHPHESVLNRLKNLHVWRTDKDGTVRFLKNELAWLVKTTR